LYLKTVDDGNHAMMLSIVAGITNSLLLLGLQ